jgi:hypothetical protein
MYVEDLLQRLACDGKYIFESPLMPAKGWEFNFICSVSSQIQQGNSLTEKQASLSVKTLKKYQTQLEAYFNKSIDLDNPSFLQPFRKVSSQRSIDIINHEGEKRISVKFPYDSGVIKQIQDYVNTAAPKQISGNFYTSTLKGQIGAWNMDLKAWLFSMREENILWLHTQFGQGSEFVVDDEFKRVALEVLDVVDNITQYTPMVVKNQEGYSYVNVLERVVPPTTDNVLEFLFQAKNQGITVWDDAVNIDLENVLHSKLTKLLLSHSEMIYVDSTQIPIDEFKDTIQYGGPTLVVIPGGSEIEHTTKWHKAALEWGIANEEMSVMFRTPNQNGGSFNQYVKDNNLNNEPTEKTRIVFVSTKLPKPLIKSGIKFKTVINLGFYSNMHFSMNVVLQSTPNIVYYNNKQPTGATVCLPQS